MKKFFSLLFLLMTVLQVVASPKTIHVLVALCDNKSQGIVPVPEKIGNGKDAANNLYWGCAYGVKTFFNKQKEWQQLQTIKNPKPKILERVIFKHTTSNTYLVADAYDGEEIKQTITDLLDFSAGLRKDSLAINNTFIPFGGGAALISYIGHNGLMEFQLDNYPFKADNKKRETIILACYSKNYFKSPIARAGAQPLLWTTHLMGPEAYTLHAAITGWLQKETAEQIRERAAQAYHQYQKCGIKAARNLLVTGF